MLSALRARRIFKAPTTLYTTTKSRAPTHSHLSIKHLSNKSNFQDVDSDKPLLRWAPAVNKFSNFALIPFALCYAVFFADFGDHEHVFSPARRWLDRQKASFFSLSPAEQKLVRQSEDSAATSVDINDNTSNQS
ncbi:hypothetical protein C8Q75DRAFT_812050 [Abortiporus biennis]|nr:hypothetical protein C8Q75DRAFT_812050 [Abortiporus biennis]